MCTYDCRPASDPVRYAPPPLEPDEDELEHYKTQVKIMTDLINVSERVAGGRGRKKGGGSGGES